MFNNFEKSIAFLGNIITILTFILSICNWLGLGFISDASIPTERAAKCILCLYCILASYGQSKALDEHSNKNQNITFLWCVLSFTYVFGFLFLLEKAKVAMHLMPIQEIGPITLAWVANISIIYAVFFFRKIYPQGGVITFIKNYFIGAKLTLMWFVHMLFLAILFGVLH